MKIAFGVSLDIGMVGHFETERSNSRQRLFAYSVVRRIRCGEESDEIWPVIVKQTCGLLQTAWAS
jgi:hypothetical protein